MIPIAKKEAAAARTKEQRSVPILSCISRGGIPEHFTH